jgi:hypothetical protein
VSKIKTTDDELMAIETSYMTLTSKFMEEGFSPMACAAIMSKLSMMMYKTSLNQEEYNLMIDTISESRDQIKSFTEYSGSAGRLN